jgi:hypothetical protein
MLATPREPAPGAVWGLPDPVHATAVDDDLVFLDVSRDAYQCLPGGAAACRVEAGGGALRIASADVADGLRSAGLIRPLCAEAPSRMRRTAQAPVESALKHAYPPPRWGDAPEIAAAVLDVTLAYRGRALSRIVGVRATPRERSERTRPTLEETLDRFHRWVPFAPVSGKCLLRAFMLRRVLHRHGHPHDWVFGVTLWPFKAHCWLQSGGLVLDDTVENVAAYRPIMVV